MVLRRRDIQLPKPPVTNDKAASNWMTAVSSLLQKYIFGGSDDRLVSAKELIDSGVIGVGTGGQITQPPKNLTKPPKVTGLTANGALASIFVGWHNPSFSNYGYTELWRADIDDIGQAFLIASTAVESYTDNVGSAATKYYWARAVSDQGVKGDFNAVNGVKGTTSLDPDYVMQVLTSSTWKPNTTYYPFQYVRPTVENGFQYAAVDGGTSGSTEPTWPTTINTTVNDGTIQWITVPVDARIPFVLGTLEDGTPAVFMDTAYIKNASITSAKISELIADKIETGNLIADLQVKNKLWYGFNLPNGDFLNPEDKTITSGKSGFYLGTNGSGGLPVLHLNTGIANGSKSLFFDGIDLKIEKVNLISSADGYFDDLSGDSVNFNRGRFDFLDYGDLVTSSDKVRENPVIDIGDPLYLSYLCYPQGVRKTITHTSPSLYLTNTYAFVQTPFNTGLLPYDWPDANTKYRSKTKAIGFSIKVTALGAGQCYSGLNNLIVYIFDNSQSLPSAAYNDGSITSGIPNDYLAKIDLTTLVYEDEYVTQSLTATKKTGGAESSIFNVSVLQDFSSSEDPFNEYKSTLITCDNDQEFLNYTNNRRLRVAVVFRRFTNKVSISTITVDFQLNAQSNIDLPVNDVAMSLNYKPATPTE